MRIFAIALLSCLTAFAYADEGLAKRFAQVMGDEVSRQQAYAAGQERAVFCTYCHGETGNSKRPHIPNLASQNPLYLFNAFEKFASGQRIDYVMSKLAKNLTQDDRVNIAVYFSQQQVNPVAVPVSEGLRSRGETLFHNTCTGCHGQHAEGMENTPRLAGQPDVYLRKALNRFRTNDPSRAGSVMIGVAAKLSEEDVDAVAAYLSRLSLDAADEKARIARIMSAAAQ
ncbi:c-type cytochrome [Stutzerimonas balearica]|uniref:c-type cytochrome n=1 Tax=Stutzerimonas balearica TaxID=74829 RepID=UPI001BAF0854|nr:c-type cytochrome [Stutzerimonas balearica]WAN09150.1 c-type cytochrome [Stutzerimonas balearica]